MGVHQKSKVIGKRKGKKNKSTLDSKQVISVIKSKNKSNELKKPTSAPVKKVVKVKSSKPVDIATLDQKLQKLYSFEGKSATKKIRKKIRQMEYLKKKHTQLMNTEKSLKADAPEKQSSSEENEDDDAMEDDDVKIVADDSDDDDNDSNDDEDNSKDDEDDEDNGEDGDVKDPKKSVKTESMKGIKRFVVFVGNLPKLVTEEDIKTHFAKVGKIKSVRIPDAKDPRKSGFAFLEVEDSLTFEKTLSMHHTMLGNKRINVLYTNPDGKNLDHKEIRKKNAKFDAMRKAGLLAGSTAEIKTRSFRRKKKRLAQEKAAAASN